MTFDPPADSTTAHAVPIRALAFDGDTAFVVERASAPPVTAAHRFRTESAPVAARVAEQVRVARDLLAAAALDPSARAAVGRGLRAVVVELRELAESYDVAPVADACRAREGGAEVLDPRAVAGIEHVAHGLLGAMTGEAAPRVVRAEPSPEPSPAPAEPFRPPTGPALVELLAHGISGLEGWPGTPLDMPAVPPPTPPVAADGTVPIETLVYRGRAALDRARVVRDALRTAPDGTAPDPDLLAELFDLLDLAAAD